MKPLLDLPLKTALLLFILSNSFLVHAQLAKQSIDTELLSELVQAKQEEVRSRVLRNFISKQLPKANHATYNTLVDLLDILTTEKNKGAMTRNMVTVIAEYAVAYGMTWHFITQGSDAASMAVCQKPGFFDTTSPDEYAKWHQLRDAVRRTASSGSSGSGVKYKVSGGSAADKSLIEFHDWLLDTTMAILRDPTSINGSFAQDLRSSGLFIRSKQMQWQGTVKEWHGDFFDQHAGELPSVVEALKNEMERIVSISRDFTSLGVAVGMLDPTGLKDLNVTSLVGDDPSGAEVVQGGAVKNDKVAAIFDLFRHSVEIYRQSSTENRFIARLADIVNNYVILDESAFSEKERFGFSIDVEGIILSLEDKVVEGLNTPTRNCWVNVRPYFTIGLNYGAYREQDLGLGTEEVRGVPTIAWAGEKIGLKWRLWDWKYTHSREANEVFRYMGSEYTRKVRPTVPAVSNCYLNIFASGVLYSIADLRTENSYDGALLGMGGGLTMFNDLEVNLSFVAPIISGENLQRNIDAGFWNVGLDIPIFEYIRAAKAKKEK